MQQKSQKKYRIHMAYLKQLNDLVIHPGRTKVVRVLNVPVLTSHASPNPRSCRALHSALWIRLSASARLDNEDVSLSYHF